VTGAAKLAPPSAIGPGMNHGFGGSGPVNPQRIREYPYATVVKGPASLALAREHRESRAAGGAVSFRLLYIL